MAKAASAVVVIDRSSVEWTGIAVDDAGIAAGSAVGAGVIAGEAVCDVVIVACSVEWTGVVVDSAVVVAGSVE